MHPTLFQVGDLRVPSYAFFVTLGFVVGSLIRRAEVRRLGYQKEPGHRWIGLAALVGAVIGTKLGMVLFESPAELAQTLGRALSFDFSGKTIVGALVVSFGTVEVAKRLVGIREPTGDGFALAFPVATGIGRIGCFLNGCCYGSATTGPLAVHMEGAMRHPVQLYESALLFALAAWIAVIRRRPRARGRLWRMCLLAYAMIRFVLEIVRGDPVRHVGPLTAVQVVCLACAALLIWALSRRSEAPAAAPGA